MFKNWRRQEEGTILGPKIEPKKVNQVIKVKVKITCILIL
jgi:hypothetical protein